MFSLKNPGSIKELPVAHMMLRDGLQRNVQIFEGKRDEIEALHGAVGLDMAYWGNLTCSMMGQCLNSKRWRLMLLWQVIPEPPGEEPTDNYAMSASVGRVTVTTAT